MDGFFTLLIILFLFGGTGSIVAIIEAIRGDQYSSIPPPTARDAEAAWLFQKVLLQDSTIPCLTEEIKEEIEAYVERYLAQLEAAAEPEKPAKTEGDTQ